MLKKLPLHKKEKKKNSITTREIFEKTSTNSTKTQTKLMKN